MGNVKATLGPRRLLVALAALVIVAIIVGLSITWYLRQERYEELRRQTHDIMVTIHNYHDFVAALPPTKGPFVQWQGDCSWRVLTLAYREGKVWRETPLDEPLARQQRHDWAASTKRGAELTTVFSGNNPPNTKFIAIAGEGTAWDRDAYPTFDDLPDTALMIVTVPESNIHWMDPGDWTTDELFSNLKQLGDEPIALGFADAVCIVVPADISPEILRKFCDVESARSASRDLLAPYKLND